MAFNVSPLSPPKPTEGRSNEPCRAGASEFMLMSVMGWTNPSQARVYTEKARRKSMAKKAMDMLDGEEQK